MTSIGDLRPDEIEAAVALWEACDLTRPWNDPRADIRREYRETDDPERQRMLLHQSAGHIENQLALVRGRVEELTRLEAELSDRAQRVREKLVALSE